MQIFDTPQSINHFQLITFKHAIRLMQKGIKPNRRYTWKNIAISLGKLTGGQYRGKADAEQMLNDIERVLDLSKALTAIQIGGIFDAQR